MNNSIYSQNKKEILKQIFEKENVANSIEENIEEFQK